MMSQQRRTTYLASVGALLLSLLVGVFLFRRKRASKPTPSTTVTKHPAETAPEDALAYWTADKMSQAQPAPLPVVDEHSPKKRSSHSSHPGQK